MMINVWRPGEDKIAAQWTHNLTSFPAMYRKSGLELRLFDGRKSGECADTVRDLVSCILMDPQKFIASAGYYDCVASAQALTRLFFTLRECPEGIVEVLP